MDFDELSKIINYQFSTNELLYLFSLIKGSKYNFAFYHINITNMASSVQFSSLTIYINLRKTSNTLNLSHFDDMHVTSYINMFD